MDLPANGGTSHCIVDFRYVSKQNHLLHWHISKKRQLSLIDKAAVVLAFIYPLTGVPQVISVMNHGSEGVSLLSWLGFAAFSAFFLVYATAHKIKPMIITNALWLVIDGLVITTVLVSKMPTLA